MADKGMKTIKPISAMLIGKRLAAAQLQPKKQARSPEKLIRQPPSPDTAKRQTPRAAPTPSVSPPQAPTHDPLDNLPFPNPGDRIRSDDFKSLSQALRLISDTFALTGTLFGRSLSEAKAILEAQNYLISRVMSVFGTDLSVSDNSSIGRRKVIQVMPIQLGQSEVVVVVTEAVETRRFAPNLLGLTHKDASERLRNILGDVSFPSRPMNASEFVGMKLSEAQAVLHSTG